MTTLTVQADEELVARASEAASRRQMSLNAVLSDLLLAVAEGTEPQIAAAKQELLQHKMARVGEGMLTREERCHRETKLGAELDRRDAELDRGNEYLRAVREAGLFIAGGSFTRDELNER